jgi:hypothetical protein
VQQAAPLTPADSRSSFSLAPFPPPFKTFFSNQLHFNESRASGPAKTPSSPHYRGNIKTIEEVFSF